MQVRAILAGAALFALVATGCGSSGSPTNGRQALKDLHDPKLAATATPPERLPSPFPAVAVQGAGGGAIGQQPDTYVVKSGDVLGAIAANLGVSVDDLARANNITDPTRIQVGQQLKIPRPGAATPTPGAGSTGAAPLSTVSAGPTVAVGGQVPPTGGAPSGGPSGIGTAGASGTTSAGGAGSTQVTVKQGDSACQIAIANNVSLQELADANGLTKDQIAKLSVGQLLKVPAPTGRKGC